MIFHKGLFEVNFTNEAQKFKKNKHITPEVSLIGLFCKILIINTFYVKDKASCVSYFKL